MPHSHPPVAGIAAFPEIIAQIASHIEIPTALAFARVAKSFTPLAESIIWRVIRLHVPMVVEQRFNHEISPRCPTCNSVEDKTQATEAGRYAAERKVEEKRGEFVRGRATAIVDNGNPGRWAHVKTIELQPGNGASSAQVRLLEKVSPFVQRLAILDKHEPWATRIPELRRESLDVRLLDLRFDLMRCGNDLLFSSLREGRIEVGTVHYVGFVILLLDVAPNLDSLHVVLAVRENVNDYRNRPDRDQVASQVDEDSESEEGDEGGILENLNWVPHFPKALSRPHKLRKLVMTDLGAHDPRSLLQEMLGQCGQVQQLALGAGDDRRADPLPELFESSMQNMPTLVDLRLEGWEPSGDCALPALRRLMMQGSGKSLPSKKPYPEDFPTLETLFLDGMSWSNIEIPTSHFVLHLEPEFASWVRGNLRLRNIYYINSDSIRESYDVDAFARLDDIQRDEAPTILIRSIRPKSQTDVELLDIDIAVGCEAHRPRGSDDRTSSSYLHIQGGWRPSRPTAIQRFTDFKGGKVPLSVINQIRRAEGPVPEGHWDRRGVEVGEAAWKVLTDWKERPRVQTVVRGELIGQSGGLCGLHTGN